MTVSRRLTNLLLDLPDLLTAERMARPIKTGGEQLLVNKLWPAGHRAHAG